MRRTRRPAAALSGAVVLSLVLLAACGSADTVAAQVVFGPASGSTNVIDAMNGFSAHVLPGPELDRQLAAMSSDGVQAVRSDAPWASVQPQPPGRDGPRWLFSPLDGWVAALAANHLRWLPVIDYSANWAKTCPGFCPPSRNATYAAFAQAVAARYGAHGAFWAQHPGLPYFPAQVFEIWNEENLRFYWSTGPDPARYARLYLAARNAIRVVDPTANVIVGGLVNTGTGTEPAGQFVQGMFAAVPELRGHVDGIGLHPYAASAEDLFGWVVQFRTVLNRLGEASAPIDITEFGWPAGDPGTEGLRAQNMHAVALGLVGSNCGIGMLAPYDWINPLALHEPGDFGFVDRTGLDTVLRPAGSAWFQGLAEARSPHEVVRCSETPTLRPKRRRG